MKYWEWFGGTCSLDLACLAILLNQIFSSRKTVSVSWPILESHVPLCQDTIISNFSDSCLVIMSGVWCDDGVVETSETLAEHLVLTWVTGLTHVTHDHTTPVSQQCSVITRLSSRQQLTQWHLIKNSGAGDCKILLYLLCNLWFLLQLPQQLTRNLSF